MNTIFKISYIVFSLVGVTHHVSGLFLDETEQYDWALHNLGGIKNIWPDKKILLVESSTNVISAMSWRKGRLAFRRILEGKKILKTASLVEQRKLVVLSSSSGGLAASSDILLQVYEASNGELVWEQHIGSIDESEGNDGKKKSLAPSFVLDEDSKVVIASMKGATKMMKLNTGEIVWETVSSKVAVTLERAMNSQGKIYRLNKETGAVSDKEEGKFSGTVSSFWVVGDEIVAQLKNGDVKSYSYKTSKTSEIESDVKTVQKITSAACLILDNSSLYCAGDKKPQKFDAKVVAGFTDKESTSILVHYSSDRSQIVLKTLKSEDGKKGTYKVVEGEEKKIQLSEPLESDPTIVAQKEGKVFVYTQGGQQVRVIDENGENVWSREEGLASLTQAVFWNMGLSAGKPIPLASSATPIATVTSSVKRDDSLAFRTRSAIDGLTNSFNNMLELLQPPQHQQAPQQVKLKFNPTYAMSPIPHIPFAAEQLRSYDANVLIIGLSLKAKKVFAIDAPTGQLIWKRYFGDSQDSEPESDVLVIISSSVKDNHTVKLLTKEKQVLITIGDTLYWLDCKTGETLHSEVKKGLLKLLPQGNGKLVYTTKEQSGVMVMKKPSKAQEGQQEEQEQEEDEVNADGSKKKQKFKLFSFDISLETNEIVGFALRPEDNKKTPTWNMNFEQLGEKIVSYETNADLHEHPAVPVHARSDASVMYRFLNPNLVSVVTESNGVVIKEGSEPYMGLNLYIINGVNGQIVHQTRIKDAMSPVQTVACENWVLMHYWNQQSSRYELFVVDLYENKEDEGVWKLLFGGDTSVTRSSFTSFDTPVAISQTWLFPHAVQGMGVTHTQRGITQKALLLSVRGQIFKIPKDQLLNPRRPVLYRGQDEVAAEKAEVHQGFGESKEVDPDNLDQYMRKNETIETPFASTFTSTTTWSPMNGGNSANLPKNLQTLKEDPIIPYSPFIGFNPHEIVSYYIQTYVTKFETTPTSLESTSLVLGYSGGDDSSQGLDLFFIPVRPAKAFDILGESFNHFILYSTSLVTVLSAIATHFVVKRKQLSDRWK